MRNFRITLNIAGRSYPLTIEREKEELFRRAEKEINLRMAGFESNYRSDTEGYLAMTALQLALRGIEMASGRSLDDDDAAALEEIDRKLENYTAAV